MGYKAVRNLLQYLFTIYVNAIHKSECARITLGFVDAIQILMPILILHNEDFITCQYDLSWAG